MTKFDLYHVILSALATGLAMWFLYGPWQRFISDLIRQELFTLRDNLFDLAATGRISFESPHYRAVRARLNSLIRYAHKTTLWRALGTYFIFRNYEIGEGSIEKELESLQDEQLKNVLEQTISGARKRMLLLVWLRSPMLILLTAMLVVTVVPFLAVSYLLSESLRQAPRKFVTWLSTEMQKEADADNRANRLVRSHAV